MNRLRDEDGFSLPELMLAASLGIIILFAILGLLDATTRLSARTLDRVETTSRLRLAVDRLGSQIRSQVCQGTGLPALTAADGDSMTFYASYAPEQAAGATTSPPLVIQRRQLTYRPATKDILETVWTGAGVRPALTFTDPPTSQILVSGVAPVDVATKVFRYYRFVVPAGSLVARPALITTVPLVAADLARTVQIEISLLGLGQRADTSVSMSSTVFVRTANATNPDNSPLCI
jgi:hypothetical protein